MADCIFCKIIEGEIPSTKIMESENIYAFLDISPVNKGHVLVIPKDHFETFEDVPDEILEEMCIAIKKIAVSLKKGLECEGYNIQMNNYKAAGQLVMHAHFHVIPRYEGDGFEAWPGSEYAEGEVETVRKKIVDNL